MTTKITPIEKALTSLIAQTVTINCIRGPLTTGDFTPAGRNFIVRSPQKGKVVFQPSQVDHITYHRSQIHITLKS
jgi:hypothetical protein